MVLYKPIVLKDTNTNNNYSINGKTIVYYKDVDKPDETYTFFTDIYNVFCDLYEFVDKKENDKITELFLSNIEWIYESAEIFDNNNEKENHYIDLLENLIRKLVKVGNGLREFIYKEGYNNFIYNEVSPKTILIIKFNDVH